MIFCEPLESRRNFRCGDNSWLGCSFRFEGFLDVEAAVRR